WADINNSRNVVFENLDAQGKRQIYLFRSNDADIAMQSAQLQAGNKVQFTYATTGNPGPFEVGLYRSTDGITYNPADQIDTQTITPSTGGGQGTGSFNLPANFAPDPTLPYLLVVADPDNTISESDENNNSQAIPFVDTDGDGLYDSWETK